jgi:hypothetical protein
MRTGLMTATWIFVSLSSFSDAHALFVSQPSFLLLTDRDSIACPTEQVTLINAPHKERKCKDKPSQATVS